MTFSALFAAAALAAAPTPAPSAADFATQVFERVCLPYMENGDLPAKATAAGGTAVDAAWQARMQIPFPTWRWGEEVAVYVNPAAKTCNVAVLGRGADILPEVAGRYFSARGYTSETVDATLATSDVTGPPPRYVQHLSVKDGVSVTQTTASDSAIGPFGILSVSDLM